MGANEVIRRSPNCRVVFALSPANCASTLPRDSVAVGTATANYESAADGIPGASDVNALRLKVPTGQSDEHSTKYELAQRVADERLGVADAFRRVMAEIDPGPEYMSRLVAYP